MPLLVFVLYAFLAVVGIQVLFHFGFFAKFAFSKQKQESRKDLAVSVIICAKNEAENLKTFLPSICAQNYPNFEIVLINDSSCDDTLEVMEAFSEQHTNIKIVNVKNIEAFWGNKKYALTLGIKAATKDYLLFTDADCKPLSEHWISEMSAHFTSSKNIILGYGAYAKIKNSLLNKLIRFETLVTATNYFSFALAGLPYMGVGRNLAYTKDEFFKANGFINHIQVRSGDDDLFVNQVATKSNTACVFTKDSFTESVPKKNFKAWYKQKRRHVSTASHYKKIHKILLATLYITNFLFWALAVILFTAQFQWQIVLGAFLFRIATQYTVMGCASKKLNETDLILLFPFLEGFLILTQLTIFINNIISKPKHWK
ncbi:glycosyltransferase [Tamlana sp. 2_MG-2023]|uniref:glycosyltransferase n=1 Tax=unclassified Tamlana TaxID=2614803 RepID=UPI0026E32C6E|nr:MULTISPECIES: glycosyltransferase [unclassified Tamlana]MDO6760287.1 glycosyltransferase [Tamlana sp. 2_MG-2023]MDO6790015.1 glycosyltransferase [Tamlana sp. 1_MG-2023]